MATEVIITAFTIAKDLAQAKDLGIKRFYGDMCIHCNTLVRYTSNNNCVKCLATLKKRGGKSPKVSGEFYCKECRIFLPSHRLGKIIKTTKGTWSLCITHYNKGKLRDLHKEKIEASRAKGRRIHGENKSAIKRDRVVAINEILLKNGMDIETAKINDIIPLLNNAKLTNAHNKEWTYKRMWDFLNHMKKLDVQPAKSPHALVP